MGGGKWSHWRFSGDFLVGGGGIGDLAGKFGGIGDLDILGAREVEALEIRKAKGQELWGVGGGIGDSAVNSGCWEVGAVEMACETCPAGWLGSTFELNKTFGDRPPWISSCSS